MNFNEKIRLLDSSLVDALKFAARIAAYHQTAKDDVKICREQIKETRETEKDRIEEEKKDLDKMDQVDK